MAVALTVVPQVTKGGIEKVLSLQMAKDGLEA